MTPQQLLVEVHDGLPRQGPGDDECTRRALRLLAPLPDCPRILDLGCGPGAQTLVLARETGGTVTAVDLHLPFLEELERRARGAGLVDRIRPLHISMEDLLVQSGAYDLVWAEGAAYIIGLRRALPAWRSWLRPKGGLGLTELSWLQSDPPQEVRDFWARHHPQMRSIPENLDLMRHCGYEPVGHFVLPESAWWDGYYTPMLQRIGMLRELCHRREDLLMTLDDEVAEIDLYRRHSSVYGYVFYVLRRD